MADRLYSVPENYHIKPSDIDTSRPFMGVFGKMGPEFLGNIIVQMCQYMGFWDAFTREQLEVCCAQGGANMAFLDWFIAHNLIVCDVNGRFCVTEEFVKKCYQVVPKKG
ncbi:MAG: hypothetical protein HZA36_03825 [Parcubacteria group bacterium]|nr:hypothetical protein [Parcubacteria group bacterium]